MKILAFAGSNSSRSINKQLVSYVLTYFYRRPNTGLWISSMTTEMPIFSVDRESKMNTCCSAWLCSKNRWRIRLCVLWQNTMVLIQPLLKHSWLGVADSEEKVWNDKPVCNGYLHRSKRRIIRSGNCNNTGCHLMEVSSENFRCPL